MMNFEDNSSKLFCCPSILH